MAGQIRNAIAFILIVGIVLIFVTLVISCVPPGTPPFPRP